MHTREVYNLRFADFHTYFVGGLEWGFSVWAHNTYSPDVQQRLQTALQDAILDGQLDNETAFHIIYIGAKQDTEAAGNASGRGVGWIRNTTNSTDLAE